MTTALPRGRAHAAAATGTRPRTIRIDLSLPREPWSVTAVRHIARAALTTPGVQPDDRHDIETALTEACTNAVIHAHTTDHYTVSIDITEARCDVEITDHGTGNHHHIPAPPGPSATGGRGLILIDALTDHMTTGTAHRAGTVLRFAKLLAATVPTGATGAATGPAGCAAGAISGAGAAVVLAAPQRLRQQFPGRAPDRAGSESTRHVASHVVSAAPSSR